MRKLALLAVPLVLAGCGGGAASLGPAPKAKSARPVELQAKGPSSERKLLSLQVWLVRGKGLVERRRAHLKTPRVATAAVQALLAGPTRGEHRGSGITTAIPRGTRLIGIGIDNGIATVDLTSQFQSGGGSHSMQLRLGQIVYTLTQFPTVDKVRFELDGAPVNVFSSEGIVLDHPVGRRDYRNLIGDCAGFPPSKQGFVAVTVPRRGGVLSTLLPVVRGCSSTFEGTLNWVLKTKDGLPVARGVAQGGSLQPGEFVFAVDFQLATTSPGVLEVYEPRVTKEGRTPPRTVVPVVIEGSGTLPHQ